MSSNAKNQVESQRPSAWDKMESAITHVCLDKHGQERRQHFRHTLKENAITVSFSSENALARFYIRDISSGGLYVKTSERPALGSAVPLQLKIQNEAFENNEFFLKTRVVRHGSDGIGLTIENSDPDSQRRLETLVKSIAVDNGLIAKSEVKPIVFQRISERKENEIEKSKFATRQITLWIVALGLIALNASMIPQLEFTSPDPKQDPVSYGAKPMSQVRIVKSPSDGSLKLQSPTTSATITFENLPKPLQKTISGANRIPKPQRQAKTAPPSRVRLR